MITAYGKPNAAHQSTTRNYDGGKAPRLGGDCADVVRVLATTDALRRWTASRYGGMETINQREPIMPFSLYDAVVPSNLQVLSAIDALLDKARAFAAEQGQSEADLIDARLAPDMLPFGYQVKCCAAHSVGGIEGVRAGVFSPDMTPWPTDFAGLHTVLQTAIASLKAMDQAEFDALADADTHFAFGETRMPFTGANFLLSFSQPNFYFHATTAYAILRAQGVKLGKRDFMGMPRIKR